MKDNRVGYEKFRTKVLAGKLITNEMSEKAQMCLIVNFITKLLLVVKKNVILVIYNKLSKIVYLMTTTEIIPVEELARLFRDDMWKLHRLLESMISNKEPQFVAELIKELNRILGIEMRLLIAFHPQTNRQTK